MHLKSLTVRGFKSFASSTSLEFEPGITCIVGPNGSGKSNVVDALSWVLGEQGAKSLRGGKMEDVIFAGTSARPPLGRAEVVLTIDNTDGALPIEYTEVTIARTLFRHGASEYAINGQTCRLLDVQELLSDSGIGREMHVIVGQGQLDSILHASPEERRGFVEEAAGVLKHRKRKEKALRKLDATAGNLTRLTDLLAEIRRQLGPLGRQAEVARHASTVQMEVRDARARLLADDVVRLRDSLHRDLAAEETAQACRTRVESDLQMARCEEAQLEQALRDDAPHLVTAQECWFSLAAVRERLRGTAGLAAERLRNLADLPDDERRDSAPDRLEAQAAELRAREEETNAEATAHRARLGAAITRRQRAEAAAAEEERRVAGVLRASADRREGLAQLVGQVNTLRSRAAAAGDEIGRLTAARDAASARAVRARRDFTALETRVAGLDAGERGLDAEHEGAAGLLADIEDRLAKLGDEAQAAEQHRAALRARKEALEISLRRKDGGGALLADGTLSGLMGSVAAVVSVRAGYETAVAAALGAAADAVAVRDVATAVEAIAHLKRDELGRAGLLLGGASTPETPWPALSGEATYAVDVLDAPVTMRSALRRLLFKTVIVDNLDQAQALVAERPDVVAVTRDGDQVATHFSAGGSSAQPSLLEVQAAVDEAGTALDAATATCERLRFEVNALDAERDVTQARVDVALARLHESDAVMAAVAEELGQFGSLARSAKAEADRIAAAITAAEQARDNDLVGLSEFEQRLAAAQGSPQEESTGGQREQRADEARAARQLETDARLALRTAEERARALQGRADSLLRAAQQERTAMARAAVRRERRLKESETATAVAAACQVVLSRLEQTLAEAAERRSQAEATRAAREETVQTTRRRVRELEVELGSLTDSVHREEMLRAEHRLRIEQLQERCRDDVGVDLEALVADYGPDQLVPSSGAAANDGQTPGAVPFVRSEQQSRLRIAERSLAQLGRINPLALEEFSALEERHRFLTEQLDDLAKTRRDLLDIIKEVDKRVEEVFAQAYADVAREFENVFARLFPGGEGHLALTEPDDLLTSGIEVEARPPGKKIKRLSLLSGGERSLVAITFLVALFKARPSPFYILDEVEAALDDTNLGRLLEIYEELRETSQLVVITHQKRTMTVADALYGVSMRGDGVSTVISQRLREPALA